MYRLNWQSPVREIDSDDDNERERKKRVDQRRALFLSVKNRMSFLPPSSSSNISTYCAPLKNGDAPVERIM